MAKQHWKGSVLLAPVPPTLDYGYDDLNDENAYDPDGAKQVLEDAGYEGYMVVEAEQDPAKAHPPMTYISVRPTRHSYGILMEQREFVINLTTSAMMKETDFCGVRSGKDVDKFQVCHFTPEPAQTVQAPLIAECPVNLECKVTATQEMGTHTVFFAEITGVNVEETYLDSKGKLNLQQCGLMAYAHGEYFALGRKLGNFGDSVRKRKKKPQPGKKNS